MIGSCLCIVQPYASQYFTQWQPQRIFTLVVMDVNNVFQNIVKNVFSNFSVLNVTKSFKDYKIF